MRTALLVAALGGFAGLGILDVVDGRWTTGVASLLLAVANALLLS